MTGEQFGSKNLMFCDRIHLLSEVVKFYKILYILLQTASTTASAPIGRRPSAGRQHCPVHQTILTMQGIDIDILGKEQLEAVLA